MILNKYKFVGILTLMLGVFTFCTTPKPLDKADLITDNQSIGTEIIIQAKAGKWHNHPTFVIWQEDMEGTILKTIFLTKAYATGIFGHENVGDTLWLNQTGRSIQPSALPYWTAKKGKINNIADVPTPENPYLDAFSGATPAADFSFKTKISLSINTRILMEVNQAWDWNEFWVNDKFEGSNSYKHSAQPSLIYAVTINAADSIFYLNPIGHGDPQGASGKMYTNLSTFTTAKDIYKEISIKINH